MEILVVIVGAISLTVSVNILMKLIKLLKPINKKEIMSLGIEPLLEHRFPNIPLYATVDGWLGKVYLDYFWKDKIKYLKIGFTQFKETVDRKIKAHQCFVNGTDKLACEKTIKEVFNKISKPADLPKMNGMSEIFVWTKQLDTIARKLMDKNQYKG